MDEGNATSVMPDLIRHPADARLRGEKSPFSPKTWAGWIPAQGRNDEREIFSLGTSSAYWEGNSASLAA
jgi:hypothetical protein